MSTANLFRKERVIDPFFEHAINQVFINPVKSAFVMDGPIGVGKSCNFGMRGCITISECVEPIQKNGKWVRESKWAAIRQSADSAYKMIDKLLVEDIFSPEILSSDNSPVKAVKGNTPSFTISYELHDKTILETTITCYGFDNQQSEHRLRSHDFMGAIIFELQGIPFNIFEVAQDRCGRFRADSIRLTKIIDGKKMHLTGAEQTKIVLADLNIPERPHDLYKYWYDVANKDALPFMFITPPSPLICKDTSLVSQDVLDKYPVTHYHGKEVVWLPNPKAYYMTRHFEARDEENNRIPWTGYRYWYNLLNRGDSHVTRNVLGRPDPYGGAQSVYKKFKKDDKTVNKKELIRSLPIYVGYDPGGHSAMIFCQPDFNFDLHICHEFIFQPEDGETIRSQWESFFVPHCEKNYKGMTIIVVPDPASAELFKNKSMSQTEGVLDVIQNVRNEVNGRINFSFLIEQCLVRNQDTSSRVNSLGWFIEKNKLTVDPHCTEVAKALAGGYKFKKLRSGLVTDIIDKDDPNSHRAEALQYAAINILFKQRRKERKNAKKSRGSFRGGRTITRH